MIILPKTHESIGFREFMPSVISLLSGMTLNRSVCSNGFETFVLGEALSIFGDDVANRSQ